MTFRIQFNGPDGPDHVLREARSKSAARAEFLADPENAGKTVTSVVFIPE